MSASGILKSVNVVSMSKKFPSRSFLLSYLNDNVFAVKPVYILVTAKERRSEDK